MQEKGLKFCPTPDCSFVYSALEFPIKEEELMCIRQKKPAVHDQDPLNFKCP